MAIEIVHYMNIKTKGNVGCVTLKLEIDKSYDQMNWYYPREVMDKIGLYQQWWNG